MDKIRINPGNIGGEDRVKAVADACRAEGSPFVLAVNAGSLERRPFVDILPILSFL